ncbi:MAG: transglycosylase SLT domain-containing protein [bacterium]|jgi:soluble lytic murein transglycosylase
MDMKKLLTAIVLILAAAGLLGYAFIWFYTTYMLSPEEAFERYGRTAPLKAKLAAKLSANPDDADALARYMDLLVLEGNLGRAELISRLTGVECRRLDEARELLVEAAEDAEDGKIENRKRDARWMAYVDWPLYGCLRFAQGMRYADSGDWMSARNEFEAIKNKKSGIKISPLLADYVEYMHARSLQEAGDHKGALRLLEPLIDANKANGLRPKVYAALISSSLALDDAAEAERISKRLEYVNGYTWEKARAQRAWGDYFAAKGDAQKAIDKYLAAVAEDAGSGAEASRAIPGIVSVLETAAADSAAAAGLEIARGAIGRAAAIAAGWNQGDSFAAALEALLHTGVSGEARDEFSLSLLYLRLKNGEEAGAKALFTSMNLGGAGDETAARALFHFGQFYRDRRDFAKAEKYFGDSARLLAPVSADAAWEKYLLSKANKTKSPYNLPGALEDLMFIIRHFPESDRFAAAAEEALPILYYQGKIPQAMAVIDALSGKGAAAETVASYWMYRIGQKEGDGGLADRGRAGLACRTYSYYELAAGPGEPEFESIPFDAISEPERVDEVLFGLGLIDAGEESAISAEWLVPDLSLTESVIAQEVYGNLPGAAWHAEEMLSRGVMTDPELLGLVKRIAFPRVFETEVTAAAARHGVEPDVIRAIMKKESGFRSDAVSSAGAAGLMQIMPDTASWLIGGGRARNLGDWKTNPEANIELGAAYIAHLLKERLAGRSIELVISAYNAGPGNVNSWAARFPEAPAWLYVELIPNSENETFTKKVLKYLAMYKTLD